MNLSRGITAYGDPGNPPILFLHGIRLGARIWEPHARALSDEFYVVTPDLPGHGALADLPFEIPVWEALLAHICGTLSRPPILVGYSLGGYVAMRYASEAPSRISGLVLAGCSTDIVGVRRSIYEVAVGLAAQFPAHVAERLLAYFFRLTLPRRIADVIIPFHFNYQVLAASRKTAAGAEFSRKISALEKPVLVVNGEWDVLFRPDEKKFSGGTQGELIIMPRTDHVAPLRRPEEFSGIVRAFARRVFSPQGATPGGPIS